MSCSVLQNVTGSEATGGLDSLKKGFTSSSESSNNNGSVSDSDLMHIGSSSSSGILLESVVTKTSGVATLVSNSSGGILFNDNKSVTGLFPTVMEIFSRGFVLLSGMFVPGGGL